jgi:hypothetical protein
MRIQRAQRCGSLVGYVYMWLLASQVGSFEAEADVACFDDLEQLPTRVNHRGIDQRQIYDLDTRKPTTSWKSHAQKKPDAPWLPGLGEARLGPIGYLL